MTDKQEVIEALSVMPDNISLDEIIEEHNGGGPQRPGRHRSRPHKDTAGGWTLG
jgi:hypothetical protein